jgi:hypothetical protein
MRSLRSVLLVVSTLGVALPLGAKQDAADPRFSLTISPLHLLSPQLQVTGEARLGSKVGASVTLGAGNISEEEETYGIWEAEGQLRYYVWGNFSQGLMIGADVGLVDVDGQLESAMETLVGNRAGGFLGFKKVFTRGFTAEVQLGPVHVWGEDDVQEWQTLHTLRVGWSF